MNAWIKFYIEECVTNINTKETDVFIFDIETASLLPLFPFSYEKPKLNPYMPILISDKVLQSNNNFNGLYDYYTNSNSPYINKGICNLEEFKYRMNIFCTGNSNHDLFENVNFEELNIGITGSIMTACLQKHNPLINHFYGNDDIDDEVYNKYFNEYYSRSDIDIMFKKSNTINFLKGELRTKSCEIINSKTNTRKEDSVSNKVINRLILRKTNLLTSIIVNIL
jgi:hypothetical protein